ncbi:MAG: hypothetical protein QW594_04625, partial [Candidatus Woesearchaeota archaeon]
MEGARKHQLKVGHKKKRGEKILVFNVGSSSIKASLFTLNAPDAPTKTAKTSDMHGEEAILTQPNFPALMLSIHIEAIGTQNCRLIAKLPKSDAPILEQQSTVQNYEEGMQRIFSFLQEKKYLTSYEELLGVGHRIVHGGNRFTASIQLTKKHLLELEKYAFLAPLHNPHNLAGIKSCGSVFLKANRAIPQVAVFDTSFHATLPALSSRYAIPEEWYKKYGI